MNEIVSSLASQTGIDVDQVQKGLGGLLTFLREHLGPELFDRIEGSIPGAAGLISSFESGKSSSSGGLMSAISGLAGKVLGGNAEKGSELLTKLSQAGFADQLQAFVPKALEMLQAHVPPEVLERIMALIPGLPSAAARGK